MTEHSDEQTDTDTPDSLLQLDAMEARVLGALIEKEHTTPEAYPLTQNALTNACNQKSSREPVTNLSPGEVGHTLRVLENRELVRTESGSRSERFSQQLSHKLSLNDKRQALICLMLLRGPQTLGELLTRSARLAEFSDIEDVRLSVLKLIERPQPLVMQLHRQAGQREDRYAHLLSGEPEMPAAIPSSARPPPCRTRSDRRGAIGSRRAAGTGDGRNSAAIEYHGKRQCVGGYSRRGRLKRISQQRRVHAPTFGKIRGQCL